MTVEDRIVEAIKQDLCPTYLEVINESSSHNVPPESETHFKVVLVTDRFSGVSRVKRHQMVYSVLSVELESGIHALAMHLHTPSEWEDIPKIQASPNCLGGS